MNETTTTDRYSRCCGYTLVTSPAGRRCAKCQGLEKIDASVAKAFFNEVAELAANLAVRWADEKEYEDLKDYQEVLQKVAVRHGIKIIAMTRRPFGCRFSDGDAVFCLKATTRGEVSYWNEGRAR